MELPRQKGFYDSRRQFQGQDDPTREVPETERPSSAPPRGQLIAGLIFLFLIVLAFFKFALPEKPPADPPKAPAPAAAH